MGDTLLQRVVTMVNYTKSLEDQLKDTSPVCQMKASFAFPTLQYIRLKPENVKVNDIIHCKSGGEIIFCQVSKVKSTGINVNDLEMRLTKNYIGFHRITKVNMPHKGSLGYTRKMFIMDQNELTQ